MVILDKLTSQERRVLAMVTRGFRNSKIAAELGISPRTVENHLYHIFDKLGVSSRTEAAIHALQSGLISSAEMSGSAHDGKGYTTYPNRIV